MRVKWTSQCFIFLTEWLSWCGLGERGDAKVEGNEKKERGRVGRIWWASLKDSVSRTEEEDQAEDWRPKTEDEEDECSNQHRTLNWIDCRKDEWINECSSTEWHVDIG